MILEYNFKLLYYKYIEYIITSYQLKDTNQSQLITTI